MFVLRMSTTLTSYICVDLEHLQITLWTLLLLHIDFILGMLWCIEIPVHLLTRNMIFFYRSNISGCTQQSKWWFKHYLPTKSSCAGTLWTRGSNKLFTNNQRVHHLLQSVEWWSDLCMATYFPSNIVHIHPKVDDFIQIQWVWGIILTIPSIETHENHITNIHMFLEFQISHRLSNEKNIGR